ncbi:DNA-binding transcriptional ArsR family regulator [Actinoplanes tereljensis]|uniref:HTH arsR-type domain-containing protein n=1 Tax=Paractinoplanes tereljensis TaxID=571912 RepID=A0A919NNN1_9ACTN|nr:hypothetical protein Ate02nite_49390 [Actinoplanes tereljensis]
MDDATGLAAWAGLLADRTRASFCLALLDGRAWTVGELARHAGVAVSTASEHANRLVTGGLLTQRRQGRHRYLQLTDPSVAALIEAMAATQASASWTSGSQTNPAQPSAGRPSGGEPSTGWPSASRMSTGEPDMGQASATMPTTSRTGVGMGQAGENRAGQTSTGPAGASRTGASPTGESGAGETGTGPMSASRTNANQTGTGAPGATLAGVHKRRNLAFARTCYDHLAGYLGVAIADAMGGNGFVSRTRGIALTSRGVAWLESIGVVLDVPGRRPVLRECLDWTERRSHLAGTAGAALCRHAFDAGWIVRIGSGRAVRVTPVGAAALEDQLGLVIGSAGRDGPGAARAVPDGVRRR